MLYYARSASLLNNNNSNQYSPIMTIQSNIDIKIRQYLRPPDQDNGQSLANYIRQVKKVRAILLAAIYNIYLQYIKKRLGKSSSKPDEPLYKLSSYKKDYSSYEERYEYRERYYKEDYRRSSYHQQQDRSQHREERSSDYKKRDKDRDCYNRDRRNTTYYRDNKRDYKDWKYRNQDRIYFVEGSSSSDIDKLDSISSYSASSLQSSSNSGSKEVAYIVINANLIYYKYYYTFIARCDQKRYIKVYKGSHLLKYKRYTLRNTLNPSRYIYSFYSSLFPIYSQLFQHLKTCKDIKNSTLHRLTNLASLLAKAKQQTTQQQTTFIQEKEENTAFNATIDKFVVKEAPEPAKENVEDPAITTFTYLRVIARTSPKAIEDVEVCLNPSASKSIIDVTFLQALEYKVENYTSKVKGINSKAIRLSQQATFTIYLIGSNNSQAILIKFRHSAQVIPNLIPNLLLGNDFIDPYKVDINYSTKEVQLGNINFIMPFQTYVPIYLPYRHKVYTKRAITLLPQQEAYIPIYYKPLLEGRNLAFYSKHAIALSTIITTKTPHIIALKNPTSSIITIPSQFPIGYINKYKDSSYFVSSQDSTFPALSIGSALLYFPSKDFAFPTINDKFVLDNKVRVIADSFHLYKQPFIGTAIQQQQQ